jgi:hypothetical protein
MPGMTWSSSVSGSVTRTYDTDFRVISQRVNGTNPISFQYDADSLLIQAGALGVGAGSDTRDSTMKRKTSAPATL